MSVKSIARAACLKNYLRKLMQQQSLILSNKLIFIILFNDPCYSFHITLVGHIPKPIKCLENEFRSHYLGTT